MDATKTKMKSEELSTTAQLIVTQISNNILDLNVDLNVYNIKVNNIPECVKFKDSANSSNEQLFERKTSEIECDIFFGINHLVEKINELSNIIEILETRIFAKKHLKKVMTAIQGDLDLNQNLISLKLNQILATIESFKSNKFFEKVHNKLLSIQKLAFTITNPTIEHVR